MPTIIDTPQNVTSKVKALKAAGIKTVIRYLTTTKSSSKLVKPAEARAMADAGLHLGLVFEIYGGVDNFKHGDINAVTGTAHAKFVNEWLPTIGAPKNAVVYFAIDTDVNQTQYNKYVLPYFKAIDKVCNYPQGIYGCGYVCENILAQKLAVKSWLSNASGWNGSRAYKASNEWSLLQFLETRLLGLDVDPNIANPVNSNIGDFIPFSV